MRQAATRGLLTVMATGSVLASTAGYAYADASAIGAAADSPGVGSGNTVQVPVQVPVNVCGNTVNVVGLLNPAMGNNCKNVTHHDDAGAPWGGQGTVGHLPGGGISHSSPFHGRPLGGAPVGGAPAGSPAGGPASGPAGGPEAGGPVGGGLLGGGLLGGGSTATGSSHGSPGVGSGNTGQVPVSIPVNACGDSVNVVGLLNPAYGDHCATHTGVPVEVVSPPKPCPPVTSRQPVPPAQHHSPPPPATTVLSAKVPTVPRQAVLASTGASDDLDVMVPAAAALVLGGGVLYRRSRPGQR
ncbi:DUF320 domain-containing protein [Streptacidiphilus sp. 4-A2]|nr:DUF320 domain-containing protein [Streptacidiphilus sp. 4-A2]